MVRDPGHEGSWRDPWSVISHSRVHRIMVRDPCVKRDSLRLQRSELSSRFFRKRAIIASRALCWWMHGGATMASPRSTWRAVQRF